MIWVSDGSDTANCAVWKKGERYTERLEMLPEAASTGAMNRRDFLRLGGAGLAGTVLLGPGGGTVLAQPGSSLKAELAAAAAKYKVPKELLMAMGYVNTLWEMPPPEASDYVEGHLSTGAAPNASCSSCITPRGILWVGPRA